MQALVHITILQTRERRSTHNVGDREGDTSSTSPAVDHDGVVASPPLDLAHLINHTGHTGQVGAAAVWGPVGDVELTHLLNSARLRYRSERAWVNVISHSSD